MPKVTFREERCKGCELCVSVCPRKIIVMSEGMNNKGFHYATITDQSKCCLLYTSRCV